MSNYVNDLNDLITAKSEIKNIIQDTLNENPSEVFSYYPSYVARIAANSGANEEIVNAYISAYLSAYNFIDQDALSANSYLTSVPSEFITQDELSAMGYLTSVPEVDLSSYALKSDLNSYVSKTELSNAGYISSIPSEYVTDSELSACGYLTQHQDLSSYVSKTELSGMSYATQSYVMDKIGAIPSVDTSSYVSYTYLSSNYPTYAYLDDTLVGVKADWMEIVEGMGYITASDLPVIDENLIPKENLTYQLGDATHNYKAAYTSSLKSNDSGITIQINDTNKYYISSSAIRPTTTNSVDLGNENYLYSATYTSSVKVGNNSQIYNDNGGITLSVSANNGVRFGSNAIYPRTNKGYNLGTSSNYYSTTYTSNLYTNTTYLQDTSYSSDIVPKETNTYTLGDASHLYAYTYTNRVNIGTNKVYIYNNGDTQMKFGVNNADRFRIDYNTFAPSITGAVTQLGTSNNPFTNTYTSYLFLNGTDIKDTINSMFSYDSSTGTLTITSLT